MVFCHSYEKCFHYFEDSFVGNVPRNEIKNVPLEEIRKLREKNIWDLLRLEFLHDFFPSLVQKRT
jgi:hypothetical protein